MRRIGILFICLIVAGCGIITGNRTAEQWLSLVYSGMIAEDDFHFSGSVVMGYDEGVALEPFAFNGEIEKHKQIALHADQSSSFVHNPIDELKFIVNNYEKAEIMYEGLDESNTRNIVVITAEVASESASERWKNQLQQELDNVTLQALTAAKEQGKHLVLIEQEIDKAQAELRQLLEQLEVSESVEITIDKLRAVALNMKENVIMNYVKDGRNVKEYRKSNVTFDLTPTEVIR